MVGETTATVTARTLARVRWERAVYVTLHCRACNAEVLLRSPRQFKGLCPRCRNREKVKRYRGKRRRAVPSPPSFLQ